MYFMARKGSKKKKVTLLCYLNLYKFLFSVKINSRSYQTRLEKKKVCALVHVLCSKIQFQVHLARRRNGAVHLKELKKRFL